MNLISNALLTSETLNEKAYKRLKLAIIQNEINPGTRIFESHIAAMFGISRTPVREAINQLINEGLIVSKGKSANYVLDVTAKDVNELYDLRLILERHTIDHIANHISHFDDGIFQQILNRYNENDSNYVAKFMRLDEEFHETLVSLVGSERLLKIYNDLIDQSKVFRQVQAIHRNKVQSAMDVHYRLTAAIKAGEYDKAIVTITQHIELARSEALKFYED